MAFLTANAPAAGLVERAAPILERLRAARRVRAVYWQTHEELSRLSDRDLADLGLHRTQIGAVARQAAEMTRG